MPPTSLAIQLDTAISAGIPTARLHGIGSDFVMAVWESAPARHQGHVIPMIDGAEAPRPYTLLTVPTSWGESARLRSCAALQGPAPSPSTTKQRQRGRKRLRHMRRLISMPPC